MSLAYHLATSDGEFSENERMVLKSYSVEMEMELELANVNTDINHVVSEINNLCGISEKKIIVFELIGLALADYKYDDRERIIVHRALEMFGLDVEFGDFCEKKLTEYLNLQKELNLKILS